MALQNKYVIVVDHDPQVLKGLVLLLEDMQMTVKSAGNQQELENIIISSLDCPDLLILPFEFAHGAVGHELIKQLQLDFKHSISTILRSTEHSLTETVTLEDNMFVLSDRIKPDDLRSKIQAFLGDSFMM